MTGFLRLVVDRAFVELWQPLTDHDDCPPNVFGEIYVGLRSFLREPEPEYAQQDNGTIRDNSVRLDDWAALAASDAAIGEELLADLSETDFSSESSTCLAINSTYRVLADIATDSLANYYLELLKTFVDRYSLRYYVDERARLCVSFSGFASALFRQLSVAAEGHPHPLQELNAFEQALDECLAEPGAAHIKTVIQKQVNLLEAFGSQHHLISGNTLSLMLVKLKEIGGWPHDSLADAARNLCSFANDYPGIRHAGTFDSATRALDLRDLASVTLSLGGLVPYLADGFEAQLDFAVRGGPAHSASAPSFPEESTKRL